MSNTTNRSQLLLIAADGLNSTTMANLGSQGMLPNLTSLAGRARRFSLDSSLCRGTAQAWEALASGRYVSKGDGSPTAVPWQSLIDSETSLDDTGTRLQPPASVRELTESSTREVELLQVLESMTAEEVASAKQALTGSADVIIGHLRAAGYAHHAFRAIGTAPNSEWSGPGLASAYKQIDGAVGELREAAGGRTLVIASVHGGCLPGSDADRGIGEGTIWGVACACPPDPQGILLISRPGATAAPSGVASLLDVAPTLLGLIGRNAGTGLSGQSLVEVADAQVSHQGEGDLTQGAYSDKEEAIVSERLRGLGYIE